MKNFKKDFPIFQKNKNLVYLDSGATSQKPQYVLNAVDTYYKNYNANVRRGLYPIAEKATERVEEVRWEVAKFIHAKHPEEIIFVRNATEAINLVAYSYASHNIKRGDTIVSTIMEHHSNFVPWQQLCLKKQGHFEVLDIDAHGMLVLDEKKLNHARFFAFTHVSNVLGTINPVKDIIAKTRIFNKDIKILVDAAQSVPHMKVDVRELDCDFLVFSGHKMLASTGIGVLYVKKELLDAMDPFLYGGEMIREVTQEKTTFANPPFKFEAGTPDIAGIISLGAAIEYIKRTGIENIQKHEEKLIKWCFQKMEKVSEVRMYGPPINPGVDNQYTGIPGIHVQRGGLISFNVDGIHAHDVAQVLGDMGICIRSGHHCAMPLHTRLGVSASARVSFYLYNDSADIDKFIEGIKQVKKVFKV